MTRYEFVIVAEPKLYIDESIFFKHIWTILKNYQANLCDIKTFHVYSKDVGAGACITEMIRDISMVNTYVEEMEAAYLVIRRLQWKENTTVIPLLIVENMSDENRIISYYIGHTPGDVYYIYEADSENGLIRKIIMED